MGNGPVTLVKNRLFYSDYEGKEFIPENCINYSVDLESKEVTRLDFTGVACYYACDDELLVDIRPDDSKGWNVRLLDFNTLDEIKKYDNNKHITICGFTGNLVYYYDAGMSEKKYLVIDVEDFFSGKMDKAYVLD